MRPKRATSMIYRRHGAERRAPYRVLVAIPARNEANCIGRCLLALGGQTLIATESVGVLVLVNGSTDATYDQAQRVASSISTLDVHVAEVTLSPSRRHAGGARELATRLACALPSTDDALLFMTDADSVPPPHWLASYAELLWADQCDVVAGGVAMLDDALSDLPRSLHQRGELEDAYERRLDRLESWVDPLTHDPWPRHFQASGANIALRHGDALVALNRRWPACGEDKALVAALAARERRIRHDTTVRVATSDRLFGRARGGMADTMRERILNPGAPCDARLEPAEMAFMRASLRCRWRQVHAARHLQGQTALAEALGVELSTVQRACERGLERGWRWLEARCPRLRRRALTPSALPAQIARADALLQSLGVPLWEPHAAATITITGLVGAIES